MLEKFLQRKETTFLGKAGNFVAAFGFLVVWTAFIMALYSILFSVHEWVPPSWPGEQQMPIPYKYPMIIEFVFVCVFAPIFEELIFRYAPIEFVRRTKKEEALVPVTIFSSIIFGWVHFGPLSVPIQGVSGFVLSVLYIKNNYSILSTILLHFLWNAALFFNLYSLV